MCLLSERGSLLPLLFFLALPALSRGAEPARDTPGQATAQPSIVEWSTSPEWKALLHADATQFHIQDPRFLLSAPNASLEREMTATLDAFRQNAIPGEEHAICRFPARYEWLRRNLLINENDIPRVECTEFRRYRAKAPAEHIKLVFSSENVYSASSMMGHVLLKMEGTNDEGVPVEHAVSYFTVLDSANLPRLLYRVFVSGMPGLFALTPYQQQKERYLIGEERNIWEYELRLSEAQKSLIQAHIWELREIDSTYFFTSYNCATAILYILALSQPEILDRKERWVSPVDVVRTTHEFGLVENTVLIPSRRWKIKMLAEQLGQRASTVYAAVNDRVTLGFNDHVDDQQAILGLELYRSYFSYLNENGAIPEPDSVSLRENIDAMSRAVPKNYQLDVSEYKNPSKAPFDSQWSISAGFMDATSFYQFRILAASHRLTDDNRQYFSESSLELGDVSLRYTPSNNELKLNEAKLYSMASINPWDEFTGGFSSKFKIGFEPHYDSELKDHLTFDVDAGIGAAVSVGRDVLAYALGGIGYGNSGRKRYLYVEPEAGLIVREIFDMKTLLRMRRPFNQQGTARAYTNIEMTQSFYLSKENAVFLSGQLLSTRDTHKTAFSLSYTRYF